MSALKADLRTYELTYIFAGSVADQDIEKAKAEIEPLLKRASAKILKTEEWGRRPLAYIITHDGKNKQRATTSILSWRCLQINLKI